jgi:4-hydroxy-3-polyprenylbenzoate decarboxylase
VSAVSTSSGADPSAALDPAAISDAATGPDDPFATSAAVDPAADASAARATRRPFVVGITGASGTPYAAAVINGLLDAGQPVDVVVSKAARLTIMDELGLSFRDSHWRDDLAALLRRDPASFADADVAYWSSGDFAAGPSSGSYRTRGMVVVPASTASVAGIAMGLSKDLIQRAADVTLKERRPLVVCVRETPLARSALRNMLALDEAGAVVLPCNPAFYHGPTQLQQLVDFVAGKVLDVLDVEHDLFRRWDGDLGGARP